MCLGGGKVHAERAIAFFSNNVSCLGSLVSLFLAVKISVIGLGSNNDEDDLLDPTII